MSYSKAAQIRLLNEIEINTRKAANNTAWVKWILLIPILFVGLMWTLGIIGGAYILNGLF